MTDHTTGQREPSAPSRGSAANHDARLAALEELSAMDQELELKYGLTGNPLIKAQHHTGASGGSLANYPAIPDSCLRGSTVEQRSCEPPVAGSTPAAGLYVQWIPVTERLPEKGVPVIGWFPGATQSYECSLNEHDGAWCDWGTGIHLYDDERPTHWMPFPDGPNDAK